MSHASDKARWLREFRRDWERRMFKMTPDIEKTALWLAAKGLRPRDAAKKMTAEVSRRNPGAAWHEQEFVKASRVEAKTGAGTIMRARLGGIMAAHEKSLDEERVMKEFGVGPNMEGNPGKAYHEKRARGFHVQARQYDVSGATPEQLQMAKELYLLADVERENWIKSGGKPFGKRRNPDSEQARVIFRRWRGAPGTVIALFPDDVVDSQGHISSYEHIGQHGGADYHAVMQKTVPVSDSDSEVVELKQELEDRGYQLAVGRRRNPLMMIMENPARDGYEAQVFYVEGKGQWAIEALWPAHMSSRVLGFAKTKERALEHADRLGYKVTYVDRERVATNPGRRRNPGLSGTVPVFQTKLARLAKLSGVEAEQIHGYWREYARDCQNYDQSPVLSEFVAWYKDKLGGNEVALQDAVQG